jgi:hypothetical protein
MCDNNYIFWKWSPENIEKGEKSYRKPSNPVEIYNFKEPSSRENDENQSNIYYNPQDVILETDQKKAYAQSIECDSINWSDTNDIMFLEHQFKLATNNKREESYNKIAEREMISQVGLNPFLQNSANNDNYIQDIVNRDLFMKPVNTNIEKKY